MFETRHHWWLVVAGLIVSMLAGVGCVPDDGEGFSGELEGDVLFVSAPPSVEIGETERDEFYLFEEWPDYTLSSDLTVTSTKPGEYSSPSDIEQGTIEADTTVRSFYLHFDPEGQPSGRTASATITFPGEILGVVARTEALFDANEALEVDDLTTIYPNREDDNYENMGYEIDGADEYTVRDDGTTLEVHATAWQTIDELRVLVAP